MIKSIRNTRSALSWLIHILKDTRWAIVLLTVLRSVMAILTTLYPMITLKVLNAVEARDRHGFQVALTWFVLFIIFQLIIWYGLSLYSEHVSFTIENRLKRFCLTSWLNRSDIHQSSFHTGELMNRLSSDIRTIRDGCITIIPNALSLIVRLVTTTVFLYFLLPQMAIIMILGGIVMVGATTLMRQHIKRLHKEVNEKDGNLRSYLQEVFQNPSLIRSFGVEKDILKQSNRYIDSHRHVFRKRVKLMTTSQLMISIVFNIAIIIGTTLASIRIMDQQMALGTYVAVAQLIAQMREPLVSLTGFIPRYFTMIASVERLVEINTDEEEVTPIEQVLPVPQSIKMSHIHFSYEKTQSESLTDSQVVLTNFSLVIPTGQRLGIVGQSGGGKSTFLKLLIGIFTPQSGDICLESGDFAHVLTAENYRAYRQLFAYVPQSNALMSGTIREIVAFSDRSQQHDDVRLRHALKVACALEFVEKLPFGVDTPIKEAGEGVSGGQMQRLAIARAIFSQRPYLVLDEATSALDERTEKRVLKNLQAMTDKTIIWVTHRKEVLSICDTILDFDSIKGVEKEYERL